jgi:protein-S-isoprenylcysteine O-methyltransferase Ste14
MNALELKIPPVAVGLIVALLMWLTSLAAPAFGFIFPGRFPCSTGLVLFGAAISISGVVSFRRAKTTVNPTTPAAASTLVVSGIYNFTRNPMYLGFLIALLGWGVFLSNALAIVFIPGFVIFMNRFQIRPEEQALASRFDRDFSAYKARVRRWV